MTTGVIPGTSWNYSLGLIDAIKRAQNAVDIEQFRDKDGNLDDDAYIDALNEAEEWATYDFYGLTNQEGV